VLVACLLMCTPVLTNSRLLFRLEQPSVVLFYVNYSLKKVICLPSDIHVIGSWRPLDGTSRCTTSYQQCTSNMDLSAVTCQKSAAATTVHICMWMRKVSLWAFVCIYNNCDYISCVNILRTHDLESWHSNLHALLTRDIVAGRKQANLFKNNQLLVSRGFLRL
jgi:hypothetical protein